MMLVAAAAAAAVWYRIERAAVEGKKPETGRIKREEERGRAEEFAVLRGGESQRR